MPVSTVHPAGVLLGVALVVALTRGVLQKLILLLGTGLGFWWCHERLHREARVLLDTDGLYRQLVARLFPVLVGGARQVGVRLDTWGMDVLRRLRPYSHNPFLVLRTWGWWPWSVGGSAAPASRPLPAVAYDADRSRLPIGVTILWILLFFVVVALYGLAQEP